MVSVVHVFRGSWKGTCYLDEREAKRISGGLEEAIIDLRPEKLTAMKGLFSQGQCLMGGGGFVLDRGQREAMVVEDPSSAGVILPLYNGRDLNNSVDLSPSRWAINFRQMSEAEARLHPAAFGHVERTVKPYRRQLTGQIHETRFWLFWDYRPRLVEQLDAHDSILASAIVTKYVSFRRCPTMAVYNNKTKLYFFYEWYEFCVLQSSLHQEWAQWRSATLGGTTFSYSTSEALETWPMPRADDRPLVEASSEIGRSYHVEREKVMREESIGLTAFYNRVHDPDADQPVWESFRELLRRMDSAAAVLYGWDDLNLDHCFRDTPYGFRYSVGEGARREVLARLLKLNHERYEEEARQGLHDKKRKKGKSRKRRESKPNTPDMFTEADK